ncbi:MAG: Gfo/Idh/MocA family oxidoreductase [Clostridiales bacterium]|nr:Gfo/Idh/MocA family oxidoreductase [Clostridiales bacterium]
MRKIKWGVLGTANIARVCTIPGMKLAENCETYAIAGRSMEKAQAYKEQFGFEVAYDSYDALLADPNVEAVYIPLPNTLHREWVIKAAKAKKHILCEKPMAPTAAEAKVMQECADQNGVVLMEAFAYLHSPLIAALKAELDSGAIGDVRYLENAFVTGSYDLSNIRMRRETLGGSVYDLGCYCISQAIWLLGEPDGVQAVGTFSPQAIDRLTTGIMNYADGRAAVFTCGMVLSRESIGRLDRLQIHGTKGFIRTDAQYNQEGTLSYQIVTKKEIVTRSVYAPQNYSLEVAQLGRCITDGEKPHVSHEMTLAIARTVDKALKAIGYVE